MSEEIQRIRRNILLSLIKNKKGRVLDIGCQNGDMCYMLSKHGFETYGIDVDTLLIQEANKKYPSLKFKYADCEKKILHPDEYFDIVWAGDVIEHIRHTDIFINEVNRVLRMGGVFALSTPEHNIIKNLFITLFRFEKHFDPEFPHYRFYTLKSLRDVLEKRGFKLINVKHIGRFWPISNSMLVTAEKIMDKNVQSQYHF